METKILCLPGPVQGDPVPVQPPETYHDLVQQYRDAVSCIYYVNPEGRVTHMTYKIDTDYLYRLAGSTALATLKKVYQASGTEKIRTMRNGLVSDIKHLETLKHAGKTAYGIRNNKNGKIVRKTVDKSAAKGFDSVHNHVLSDGMDCLQDAALAILENLDLQVNGKRPLDLEEPYDVKRLDKKIYIQSEKSAAYSVAETTPIQEIFRAVRAGIYAMGSVEVNPRSGYTYLESFAVNPSTGEREKVYKRSIMRYADIGGEEKDFHSITGVPVYAATQAGFKAERRVVKMVDILGLSTREKQIYKLRLKGYGKKAIATYCGVKVGTITVIQRRIAGKAEKAGLKPSGRIADMLQAEKKADKKQVRRERKERKRELEELAERVFAEVVLLEAIRTVGVDRIFPAIESDSRKKQAARGERDSRRIQCFTEQKIVYILKRWKKAINDNRLSLVSSDVGMEPGGRLIYSSSPYKVISCDAVHCYDTHTAVVYTHTPLCHGTVKVVHKSGSVSTLSHMIKHNHGIIVYFL